MSAEADAGDGDPNGRTIHVRIAASLPQVFAVPPGLDQCQRQRRGEFTLAVRADGADCPQNKAALHPSATATGRQRIAASIPATSIFFICIIASNARLAVSPPAAIAPVRTIGVICQEIPHLSLHHPH